MTVNKIGSNMSEVKVTDGTILISYSTPVAAYVNGSCYKTSKKWSNTTSRHISKWLNGSQAELKDQAFFDELLRPKTRFKTLQIQI